MPEASETPSTGFGGLGWEKRIVTQEFYTQPKYIGDRKTFSHIQRLKMYVT